MCLVSTFACFQVSMAAVLAFNRYTALYKPTKHDTVEKRECFCKKTPLQLWSNKRQTVYVAYCLLTCLVPIVADILAEPYFHWQTIESEGVGNVTIAYFDTHKPSMLVRINAVSVRFTFLRSSRSCSR